MHRPTRLKITDLNPHFTCVLCDGYIVDATTIIECLHSFCRTCIVRYLENSKFCPVCDVQVHKTKPLLSIRSDKTLQDIMYKLVPGLYQNEMKRRREFYAEHPEAASQCTSEERGEGADQRFIYAPDENISLSLEYVSWTKEPDTKKDEDDEEKTADGPKKDPQRRYLRCPAAFTVWHLKKFVAMKFSLPLTYNVEIMYHDDVLNDDLTLMDIAYIYAWRRAGPMRFSYNIMKRITKRFRTVNPDPVPASAPVQEPESEPTPEPEQTAAPAADECDEPKEKIARLDPEPDSNRVEPEPKRPEEPTLDPAPVSVEDPAPQKMEEEAEKAEVAKPEPPKAPVPDIVALPFLQFAREAAAAAAASKSRSRKHGGRRPGRGSRSRNNQHSHVHRTPLVRLAPYPPPLPPARTTTATTTAPAVVAATTTPPVSATPTTPVVPEPPKAPSPPRTPEAPPKEATPPPPTPPPRTPPPPPKEPESPKDPESNVLRSLLLSGSSPPPASDKADPPLCNGDAIKDPDRNSEAFRESVKNSISAEFSDNDDLGCQPDLVVDEKADSSDEEEDALRKKITAIAEKEDEGDDADSGRASDISSQARSSCDDDVGSPLPPSTAEPNSTATAATTTATAATTTTTRPSKSMGIDRIINNLYRNHEKKDGTAENNPLDLTLGRMRPANRPACRRVANPVLDYKHQKQSYLPAPTRQQQQQQHTACVPAPKPPTPSLPPLYLAPQAHLPLSLQYAGAGGKAPVPPAHQSLGALLNAFPRPPPSKAPRKPPAPDKSVALLLAPHGGRKAPPVPLKTPPPTSPLNNSLKLGQSSFPLYKKSDSSSSSASPSSSSSSSSKGYVGRFKGTNLTVYNPDPNGYRQKIVIKNLDFKPNNQHPQRS